MNPGRLTCSWIPPGISQPAQSPHDPKSTTEKSPDPFL